MNDITRQKSMGWLHDYPDYRDLTPEMDVIPGKLKAQGQNESVKEMLSRVGVQKIAKKHPDSRVDLRQWFPATEDQKELGSCTAHAGVGLLEYYERRAFGKHIDASRLFLYKVTRNMLRWNGDTGAFLRTTMGAMALFGIPPEDYWPYDITEYDKEPSAFCYAYGKNFQAINYYRLDPPGVSPERLLERIKTHLAAGLPSMFGFTVYSSFSQAGETGKIPFPVNGEKVVGGHAVVAAGYDDDLTIVNSTPGSEQTKGAILIRNSWGTGWGEKGYGWLPYDYIIKGLAVDWWSLIKSEWVDALKF